MTLLDYALAAHDAGRCIVPPRQDGTKAPIGTWERYQTTRPTREQVERWYSITDRTGIGYVGGAVSGGLELFEFEGRAVEAGLIVKFIADAKTVPGLTGIIDRISSGWSERSPSGGVHLHYLCEETGCVKLARRADGKDLIETKGEGGYMIGAPSNGAVHPAGGAWEPFRGGPATVATITPAERQLLHDHARSYQQWKPKKPTPAEPENQYKEAPRAPRTGDSWMDALVDDYNSRTTWADILAGHFEYLHDKGLVSYWHYTGADNIVSATTNAKGTDTLIVFSGTAEGGGWDIWDGSGQAPSYDRFSATALLEHAGDRVTCAKALRDEGYGPPPTMGTDLKDLLSPGLNGRQPPPPRNTPPPEAEPAPQPPPAPEDNWPVLAEPAYLGPIGEFVRHAAPHTEADPVAILVQLLTGIGCLANSGPHTFAGQGRHPAALFTAIVGDTSRAKKGTSWEVAKAVLRRIDPDFISDRVFGGFGSGEILIETLAEAKADGTGEAKNRDTRAMVQESELANIMKVAGRDGSTLGQTLRNAWDGQHLAARSRGKGTVTAKDYHVSLIGHITIEELKSTLADVQTFGGTTNRFLWCLSRRANVLPEGGNVPDHVIEPAARALATNLTAARLHSVYTRTPAAKERWHDLYHQMAEDNPPGLLGAAIARAEPQMLRLSLAYAISCGADQIGIEHIEAAWALWSYSRATAEQVFPATTSLADRILVAIRGENEAGMSRTSIHAMLSGHVTAAALNLCIGELIREQLVVEVKRPKPSGKGRPAVHIVAAEHVDKAGDK